MGGLTEVAGVVLANSTRRVEVAGQNIANSTTGGYKRRIPFARVLEGGGQPSSLPGIDSRVDLSPGKLVETSNSADLAILGDGFFSVKTGERTLFTRQGQFRLDEGGRLVNAAGQVLQAAGGGDLALQAGPFVVRSDGTVLQGGEPVDRIALAHFESSEALRPDQGGAFAAVDGFVSQESPSATVRQGAYEASNVSTGEEMVAIMESLRQAEAGQRLMTVYDDLMGRAVTTFGQSQ
ncbi:MAG TPA: flagellar hook basal-body protein [Phenylobacterium sp.]